MDVHRLDHTSARGVCQTIAAVSSADAVGHRRVWRLTGPIILSNLSVPLVGAVDTAVVGRLPDPAYIGAVALGAIVFSLVFWAFGFLRMATTGFVAQAYGAGDRAEIVGSVGRALLLAAAFGALLILLRGPIGTLTVYAAGDEPALRDLTRQYYQIRIWSAPATLVNYVILGWLIGVQRTGVALILQLLLNLTNVTLDVLFVIGLGLHVDGVALATLIGEYLTAAAGLFWLWRETRPLPSGLLERLRDGRRLIALARVNVDILIRTACLSYAFFYFTTQSARLGTTLLAANAVLMHLQSFLAYGLDGFAHAAGALTGAAKGARDRATFTRSVRVSTAWALLLALLYAALYWLAGEALIALFTDIDAVREAARTYLPWLILSPLISVWSFQLDGIFIGMTQTAAMRNAMLLSLGGFLLATSLLTDWGNHGLWLALTGFMALRAVTLLLWYPKLARF